MTQALAFFWALSGLVLPVQESAPIARTTPRVEPASGEGEVALQRFRPAPGIAVELFAAEPLLANPVCFAFDRAGTVYVAETFRLKQGVTDIRDHMDWLDEDLASRTVADRVAMLRAHAGERFDADYGAAEERVRRLRDTDGDGRADEALVFAGGFRAHEAGIGAGLLAREGDVFYACIPDLWRLRDTDADGVADEQRALSSGYGVHVALLGHDLHGLVIGPDRRLYFSCGDRGFAVETEHGTIAHSESGAVLRCELDGSGLEVWHDGLRNPQELAFDERGDLFTGDNNSDGGDRARLVHVVEGGDSGWRYPYQWITAPVARGPWNDEKLWHPAHPGQAAYVVPPIANLADGPSGLAYYPGTGLADAYRDHFFLCDFRGEASSSLIHAFRVHPRGASFELGTVVPFVRGVLATDCAFGPDGALWFSDWVYGWDQTGKGRLYRALDPAAQGSELVRSTRAVLAAGMDGRGEDELLGLLAHPDARVRQEAHFALGERGTLERIASSALDGSNARVARVQATWALWVRARRDPGACGTLRALAEEADPEIRAQALRALGDVRDAGALAQVLAGLEATEPRVRFFAALAAGRIAAPEAVEPLARLLRETGESDRDLRHAGVMGLLGAASAADLERLARDASPHVRTGVLLVLRRKRDASIARFLDDAEPALVFEAARAIHDLPIEPALGPLAGLDPERSLVPGAERALVRRVLDASFRLGRANALAAHAVRETLDAEFRIEALDMLADWAEPAPRDRVTNEWRPLAPRDPLALAGLALQMSRGPILAAPDPVLAAWVRFAATTGARDLGAVLGTLVADVRRSSEVKVAALAALGSLAAPELPAAVRAALGDTSGTVRAAALARLEELAPEEALARLPAIVAAGEIAERRASYAILGARAEPACADLLAGELERLGQELVPAELALDLVEACESRGAPRLGALLEQRRASRAADPALGPWLDGLFGGDAARGRTVFEQVELSCTRCHAWWGGADERVGPNLFGVSGRLTRLQILESIVAPNRNTTSGFGGVVLFLDDGTIASGRVLEETDELVRLIGSDGVRVAVERERIAERRADLSSMPEDLARSISRAEMRDLLQYLGTL